MKSMTRCSSPFIEAPTCKTYISLLSLHPLPKHPLHHLMHLLDLDWYSLGNTPHLRKIIPIGHLETLSKPGLLNCIMSLSICLGKGGFDAHVWVTLLLDVIDISMIQVTYEPMEGVLVVVVGPHPTDMYTWRDD